MGNPSADAASADLMAKAAEPPVPAAKADLPRRIAAALVDSFLAGALWMIPFVGVFVAAAYLLLRDGVDLPVVERRSVGKKIVGLRVVRANGAPMGAGTAVQRNLLIATAPLLPLVPVIGWIAPYVSFLVAVVEIAVYFADAEGQRLGDRVARTQVIVEPGVGTGSGTER
jgi:uncharacterized RDD family membrane protein YckC